MSSGNGHESAKDAALVACIDASTPQLLLALGRFDASRPQGLFLGGRARGDQDRKNSALLVPLLESLLKNAGQGFQDLQGIVCGVGPGTFTGTRVAVATAKGLALGLNAALWALDSLSIFAAAHASEAPGLVVLDARRSELYAASYAPDPKLGFARQSPVSCIPIDAVNDHCPTAPQWIAGSGAHLVQQDFAPSAQRHQAPASAAGLWQASQIAIQAPQVSVESLDVFYLRASYAEFGANPPKTPPYHSPFAP